MHINEFLRTRLVEWANWSQLANGQVGKDVKLTSNERKFLINFLGPATTMVCFQLDSLEKLSLNFSSWLDEQENEHEYAGCTKYQPTKAVSNDIYQEKISTLGAKGCPPFRFLMLWDARLYLCMEKSSGNKSWKWAGEYFLKPTLLGQHRAGACKSQTKKLLSICVYRSHQWQPKLSLWRIFEQSCVMVIEGKENRF